MYKATIKESSKQLSARERIKYRDEANVISIDELMNMEEEIIITPDFYLVVQIETDEVKNHDGVLDYEKIVVVDKSGKAYSSGSESLRESFVDIFEEMSGEDEEYQVQFIAIESKNYKDKSFYKTVII